jgi:hypothetical protein
MSEMINLKELERLAFRRTFQDGLYDIYLGGLFASFAAFAFTVFPGTQQNWLATLLYYLVGIGLSGLVFWLGKKYVTLPRIGMVNFGPARKKRNRDLLWALAVIVFVQVVVVIIQFTNWLPPVVREWLSAILGRADNSNLVIAVVAALFVAPGMLFIAYKAEIPHGYYHSIIMALGVFLMILFDQAWWMVAGGILILLPGLVQLVRFLRRYPLESISDGRP